jgi:large subunit ribosomal protein L19e
VKLRVQKRLAADVLKCSPKRVWIGPDESGDIKEAITKVDIKSLVKKGLIKKKPVKGISRFRARKIKNQKKKGKQKGPGSRRGKKTARLNKKKAWISKIRIQRDFLKKLRDKKMIDTATYQSIYRKSKGGFFRSKRHIKIYLEDHNLIKKK